MAITRRITIGRLMVAVLLVAVDFGVARAAWGVVVLPGGVPWFCVAIVTLPMINVLLMAVPKLRVADGPRPFWVGFEVAGVLAVAILAGVAVADPRRTFWPIDRLWERMTVLDETPRLAVLIPFAVVLYTAPLGLLARAAGHLSARGWAATRRRRGA